MQSRLVHWGYVLGVLFGVAACGATSKDAPATGAVAGASASGGGAGGSSSGGAGGIAAGAGTSALAGNAGAQTGGGMAGTASGGTSAEAGAAVEGGSASAGEGGSAGEPEIPVECGEIKFRLQGAVGGPALCLDICSEDWIAITDPKGRAMGGAYPPVGCPGELYQSSKAYASTRPLRQCVAGVYHATMCAHVDPDVTPPAAGAVSCKPKGDEKCVEVQFEATATEVVGTLE